MTGVFAAGDPRQQMNSSGLELDPVLAQHGQIRRIGLLSPYSGGNRGNTAIISAAIHNIRKRIEGVQLLGITLAPEAMKRLHGIEGFPLAGVSRPYYGVVTSRSTDALKRNTIKFGRIKTLLKRTPAVGVVLKALRTCAMELAHIAKAALVVRTLDCIIVPGGGALDEFWGGSWGHPWALFKWSVLSRAFGVPFLFVSVGKSSLQQPLSRFFVRIALRFAKYRSYRDDDSKAAVQTLIDARNDPVFPDLAFSYPGPLALRSSTDSPQDGRLLVGVSPIAYCDPRAWPHKEGRRYAQYVNQLAEMVQWLIREHYRVLFFTTDSPDSATVDDVRNLISGGTADDDTIRIFRGSPELNTDGFLKGISLVDMTIASRLHGVILSHLNSTPVLALSFDPKVDAHMKAVAQGDYCLDINYLRFDWLVERFTALKAARHQEQEHLRYAAKRFREMLDVQYARVLGSARSGS